MTKTAAFILAAGLGTRMKSTLPKVFHQIGGLPMVEHVVRACTSAAIDDVTVVLGPEAPAEAKTLPNPIVQTERNGTGGAVQVAWDAYLKRGGDPEARVIVLFGDTPLIDPMTIESMAQSTASLVVLGFEPSDAAQYGRIERTETGAPTAIVEYKDATDRQRAISLCNAGLMAIDGNLLGDGLVGLTTNNAQAELYLTDLVAFASARGAPTALILADAEEVAGVNSRAQLAEVEGFFQVRKQRQALDNGVTLQAPTTVQFSHDTDLEADVHVEPNVVFAPGVSVKSGARIRAFSHLEGCTVAGGAIIGPYARLRPGTEIGRNAKIGNFVEIKNTTFAEGAKANHLTYVGDASVGSKANIGAGTITCNYDGYNKARTVIGENAFIGSNSALVAPVEVGANATVAAGSTVVKNVAPDALAIARAEQKTLEGVAKKLRTKLAARKAAAATANKK